MVFYLPGPTVDLEHQIIPVVENKIILSEQIDKALVDLQRWGWGTSDAWQVNDFMNAEAAEAKPLSQLVAAFGPSETGNEAHRRTCLAGLLCNAAFFALLGAIL